MSTQPSVIQWSSVTKVLERETDTSKVNVPENSIHEVDKWSGNSERIITVPIKKSKDNKSGITEYLDVQIEVLSEINADDDKIVTDPKEEYFDVRIEVESDVCTQPMIKNKISLDNSVQKKIKDRRKASSLYKSKPYICSSCGKVCSHALNEEILSYCESFLVLLFHFFKSSLFQCFSTRQHVERHSNLHSKETLYPCPECEKVLLDRSYLLRHMKVHAEVKSFTCSICDKKFCTASSVKRHITTHDPSLRPYCCSDCDKRFPDNSSLKKHSLIHSGVKTHICIICAKGFSHVGDYNAHLKGHEVVKQYRCDQCGKDFSRHNNLVRHKAVHADSNFQCVICKGCFQHASTLTRHILSCHPGTARVRKKRAGSQACENSSPESSLQNGVTTQKCSGMVSENIISGSTTEDVALASLDDSEGNYCKDVNSESCRNLTDHAELDQPSFEIFQFDASGTLVKVTEAVPLQVFNSCREQPYSIL